MLRFDKTKVVENKFCGAKKKKKKLSAVSVDNIVIYLKIISNEE